ncbi:DUF6233 domain-containing protein [Streptomyces cacaoi]|uniref:DUF6233 domain-containing protein n=1 Tax=Streptomyces cacaoi TaxID=1898 RepID=UPI0037493180
MGTRRPPIQVHAGDCHMAGKRRRPIGRDEVRRLLAGGLRPCTSRQVAADRGLLQSNKLMVRRRWRTRPGVCLCGAEAQASRLLSR